MIRQILFFLIFFINPFTTIVRANCFEPFNLSFDKYSINRYSTKEICVINSDGTDYERIKVWENTPDCTEYYDRGCIREDFKIKKCSYGGGFNPGLTCRLSSKCRLDFLYDREYLLKYDAPIRQKIYSCLISELAGCDFR